MDKLQIQKLPLKKACFGTKEWSENSGICKRCESKKDCGKVNSRRNS